MNPFSHIKSQLSIVDVVSRYTALKKAGMYWKGVCPFHAEKTASFTVSPHREIFYCFGCHAGGDVITFMSKVEQCTPIEAVHWLAEQFGIELPQEINAPKTKPTQKKQYAQLCQEVALWCHNILLKSPVALRYLKKRGVSQESIERFTLGYFPSGLSAIKSLIQTMNNHSIFVDDLLDAHIIAQGKTVLFSSFEDRIMFPIKDHLGQFCGFGGRVFKPQDTRAKYYNSHENEYFNKGSLLFGFDLAKKSIQSTKELFLVEGYLDCIAMVQHGYPNTVATLGTACSPAHLHQLARHAQRAYVVYDGDLAGHHALLRLAQLCWQVNMELSVISLPAQQDPASLLLENQKNLQKYLEQATDIFTFFIASCSHDFATKSLQEKMQQARAIIQVIAKLDDPLKQDLLLTTAAQALSIPFQSLKREIAQTAQKPEPTKAFPIAQKVTGDEPDPINLDAVASLEKRIFFAIMNNMSLFNMDNNDYLLSCLSRPLRIVLQKLYDVQKELPAITFIEFFDTLAEQEKQMVSMICLEIQEHIEPRIFQQLLAQLQRSHWKRMVKEITKQLEQARDSGDKEQVKKLISDFEHLRTIMTAPHTKNY